MGHFTKDLYLHSLFLKYYWSLNGQFFFHPTINIIPLAIKRVRSHCSSSRISTYENLSIFFYRWEVVNSLLWYCVSTNYSLDIVSKMICISGWQIWSLSPTYKSKNNHCVSFNSNLVDLLILCTLISNTNDFLDLDSLYQHELINLKHSLRSSKPFFFNLVEITPKRPPKLIESPSSH